MSPLRPTCRLLPILGTLTACLPTVATKPVSPPIDVPKGCEDNLSGAYVHAADPAFEYLAEDDGGTLLITLRGPTDGGSRTPGSDIRIELMRTSEGFWGRSRGTAYLSAGHACPVDFPTQIVACSDAGLVLRTASSIALDQSCQSPPGGSRSAFTQHRLVRTSEVDEEPDDDEGSAESADGGGLDGGRNEPPDAG